MTSACDGCLRRSALLALLGPRISLFFRRSNPRTREILALSEQDLIAAVAGPRADRARRLVDEFDAADARDAQERAGLHSVCGHQESYPLSLRPMTDAPAVLYATRDRQRREEILATPLACVVGARRASAYGLEVARELGRGLAAAGVTVVSGLALGIDAAAHRGALEGGGRPVAVLAGGADRPYPRAHRSLYRRVRERGMVIAELPPGQAAFRWSFPARNRIMAGLSEITVVVEAGEPSGSLITAQFAADLGRTVGAVPGWVTSRMAAGANGLLRDGAHVIRGAEDVLEELFGVGGAPVPAGERADGADLDRELRLVLDGIEAGEGAAGAAHRAGLSATQVRAALGRLELMGLLRRDALGGYLRAATT